MSPALHSAAMRIAFNRLEAALIHLEATTQTGDLKAQDAAAKAVEQARLDALPFLPRNQKQP